jgi:hypothetical protein
MATTTSQVPNVITQIHTTLSARVALAGVAIFKRAVSPRDMAANNEYIVIAIGVTGTQEYPFATNMVKRDAAALRSLIFVRKSGAGDAIAEDVDERVHALFAEVEAALQSDPSLTRAGRSILQITDYRHTYAGDDSNREQSLEFTIDLDEYMVST